MSKADARELNIQLSVALELNDTLLATLERLMDVPNLPAPALSLIADCGERLTELAGEELVRLAALKPHNDVH